MADLQSNNLVNRLQGHELRGAVIQRLRDGDTPKAVGQWLQEDLLEFVHADPRDLTSAIQALFVLQVPVDERLRLMRGRSAIARTVARQRTDESTLERLNKLLDLQFGRIEMLHEIEEAGMPMGSVSNEVEIARRLIRDKHGMEQTLGSDIGRRPGSGSMNDETKAKLAKVLTKLMKAEDEPTVTVVESETQDVVDAQFKAVT